VPYPVGRRCLPAHVGGEQMSSFYSICDRFQKWFQSGSNGTGSGTGSKWFRSGSDSVPQGFCPGTGSGSPLSREGTWNQWEPVREPIKVYSKTFRQSRAACTLSLRRPTMELLQRPWRQPRRPLETSIKRQPGHLDAIRQNMHSTSSKLTIHIWSLWVYLPPSSESFSHE
jgi:hypothetical protein